MQRNATRKKFGNYPFPGVIISITLALLVAGLLGLLIAYAAQFEKVVRNQVRVQIYLKNGLTDNQRIQLERKLEALPFVNKSVPLQFISKEEAAKNFIEQTGEDFTRFLGENPLHDAYLISILPEYHTKEKLKDISQQLQSLTGVFQVYYVQELIEAINQNATRIALLLAGILAVLLLAVVMLIHNTIRLALFSQRFLIRSMQLVGATAGFIKRPFLLRALLYGLIGGLLASASLYSLARYGQKLVPELTLLHNPSHEMTLFGILILAGIILTFFSTFFAMRKYLNMSLDELY
ncbi:MAG: cell division protein FtsX [Cyclobacteriaceae bacterium]|nr:MAG: cell division protein FtsX [Cyclobacteriaceae bacterium]